MSVKYEVCIVESERGWGQKYEFVYFDTYEDAKQCRDDINASNTPSTVVPDWYMIAKQEIKVVEK